MTRDEKLKAWGEGPWLDEMDDLRSWDKGFVQVVRRNMRMGYLCGYLGVFKGHPWYELAADETLLSVHGDVDYAGPAVEDWAQPMGDKLRARWFFGFHCAHAWDVVPKWKAEGLYDGINPSAIVAGHKLEYRTWDYVRREVNEMQHQAMAAWRTCAASKV